MIKTTIICDACCSTIKAAFIQVDGIDLCKECCNDAVRRYLQTKKEKVLRSECTKCNGTGKVRIRDDEATNLQATCGENRTQYKMGKCEECTF